VAEVFVLVRQENNKTVPVGVTDSEQNTYLWYGMGAGNDFYRFTINDLAHLGFPSTEERSQIPALPSVKAPKIPAGTPPQEALAILSQHLLSMAGEIERGARVIGDQVRRKNPE
jgi:hypothetical protein